MSLIWRTARAVLLLGIVVCLLPLEQFAAAPPTTSAPATNVTAPAASTNRIVVFDAEAQRRAVTPQRKQAGLMLGVGLGVFSVIVLAAGLALVRAFKR